MQLSNDRMLLFEGSTASDAHKRNGKQQDLSRCSTTNHQLDAFTLEKKDLQLIKIFRAVR